MTGRNTSTIIHWEAITSGVDHLGNPIENITLSGTATSEPFEQNTSTADTVERTITFSYLGVTAETTIIQGVWIDFYYNLDLNN